MSSSVRCFFCKSEARTCRALTPTDDMTGQASYYPLYEATLPCLGRPLWSLALSLLPSESVSAPTRRPRCQHSGCAPPPPSHQPRGGQRCTISRRWDFPGGSPMIKNRRRSTRAARRARAQSLHPKEVFVIVEQLFAAHRRIDLASRELGERARCGAPPHGRTETQPGGHGERGACIRLAAALAPCCHAN